MSLNLEGFDVSTDIYCDLFGEDGDRADEWDQDQPRGADGQWTSGGASARLAVAHERLSEARARHAEAAASYSHVHGLPNVADAHARQVADHAAAVPKLLPKLAETAAQIKQAKKALKAHEKALDRELEAHGYVEGPEHVASNLNYGERLARSLATAEEAHAKGERYTYAGGFPGETAARLAELRDESARLTPKLAKIGALPEGARRGVADFALKSKALDALIETQDDLKQALREAPKVAREMEAVKTAYAEGKIERAELAQGKLQDYAAAHETLAALEGRDLPPEGRRLQDLPLADIRGHARLTASKARQVAFHEKEVARIEKRLAAAQNRDGLLATMSPKERALFRSRLAGPRSEKAQVRAARVAARLAAGEEDADAGAYSLPLTPQERAVNRSIRAAQRAK